MNRPRLFLLVLVLSLLLASCSRKSASNSNPDDSNNNQTAASQPASPAQPEPAVPPQAAPQATPPPPPPNPTVTTKKAEPAVKPMPPRAAAPPPPAPKPIVIPAGTVLHVRLDQPVSSKTNHTGDPFQATVSTPVVVQGKTIVPTGARAAGTVTDAKDAGRFKGAASLSLALNSVNIGGKPHKVQTAPATQESKGKGSRTAKMVGGGTAGGALIGGIAGGGKGAAIGALVGAGAGTAGAATGNADINVPVETVVAFKMTEPVVLQPAPAQGNVAHEETPPSSEQPN